MAKAKTLNKQRKYYFVSGLPRSGSTLLCNILAQNPDFHTTATSGIMEILFTIRNNWDRHIEFMAHPDEAAKMRVLRGVLDSYYSTVDKSVVFDKSRGWLSLLEMAESILGHKAKVIVPVRDLRDILASFEKIWRETSKTKQISVEPENYVQFQTVQGRTEFWLRGDQPVGLAYNRITDAIARGYADRMFLLDFDDLTKRPEETMVALYDFLGEPYFKHNFNKVEQVTWEDDTVHGAKNLHTIRQKVEPVPPQWPSVLGPFAERLGAMNFWKNKA